MNTSLRLDADPSSVRVARRHVSSTLGALGVADWLLDAAVLLTSELVTNAVLHAGTDSTLSVSTTEQLVRVELADGSLYFPSLRIYGPTVSTGRGLRMVAAVASRWGVSKPNDDSAGKVVWFELDTTGLAPDVDASAALFADVDWLRGADLP